MRTAVTAFAFLLGTAFALPASADNDKAKGSNQAQGQSQGHGQGQGPGKGQNQGQGQGQSQGQGQGQGKGDNDNDQGRGRAAAPNQQVVPLQQVVIGDRDRDVMHTYYRNEFAAGRCPPGLAKKNNGCMPPGQVNRAWVVGQPLAPEIAYYPLPRELYTQLTPPPYGYEYVRIDNNVLLINATSRLIAQILFNVGG